MMLLYTAACGRDPDRNMASNVSKAAHLHVSDTNCSRILTLVRTEELLNMISNV